MVKYDRLYNGGKKERKKRKKEQIDVSVEVCIISLAWSILLKLHMNVKRDMCFGKYKSIESKVDLFI